MALTYVSSIPRWHFARSLNKVDKPEWGSDEQVGVHHALESFYKDSSFVVAGKHALANLVIAGCLDQGVARMHC